MTAQLVETFIVSIVLMGMATFLIFWVLDHVVNEAIKTGALIIYGFCFIITLATLVVEFIKVSLTSL
ncbi:hypothetical protein ACIGQ5_22445 [Peribacillus frigoritolerans]|uniref:hypothetical protein n=1 Tax=Peribacillus frigoritolerans TaxID=450367 RepID=UPI0037C62297